MGTNPEGQPQALKIVIAELQMHTASVGVEINGEVNFYVLNADPLAAVRIARQFMLGNIDYTKIPVKHTMKTADLNHLQAQQAQQALKEKAEEIRRLNARNQRGWKR